MGLTNPVTLSTNAFQASQRLTAPLAALIITQQIDQNTDPDLTRSLKNSIYCENRQRQDQQAMDIYTQLTPQLKRCVDLAAEKGSCHPGLRPSHSLTMDFFFTRESSETLSASDTTGSSRTHYRPAAPELHSPSTTP